MKHALKYKKDASLFTLYEKINNSYKEEAVKKRLNLILAAVIILWIIGCAGPQVLDNSKTIEHRTLSISVREFSIDEADNNYTGNSPNFGYDLAAKIEKKIRRSGKFSQVEMTSQTDIPDTDLVVEGRYKPISWTTLAVEGKIIKVKDKKEFAVFEYKRHSLKGMEQLIEELADDIADFIKKQIQNGVEIQGKGWVYPH